MRKPISELRKNISKERLERIERKTAILKKEMALQELRQALDMTQSELAKAMKINQAAVSKFENQSDIYIGTLRKILSAMGGELKIVAHFEEGDVTIDQFNDIRKQTPAVA